VANGTARLPSKFSNTDGKLMDNFSNVIVYIDNLLIHSQNHEQHLASLDLVMQRLEENDMKINLNKH
jgi:hypothetical protein